MIPRLRLLPRGSYRGVKPQEDPIRYYYWPIFGQLYRRRVEMCLARCVGGGRVLEVGCGSGVAFLNLHRIYDEIHGLDLTADLAAVRSVFTPLGIEPTLLNGSVLDMPYAESTFNTVLLISILEHLQPSEQDQAFGEIFRVLKPGGQVVYGAPVERPFMVAMYKILGYDIRQAHFSTEKDISVAAGHHFRLESIVSLKSFLPGGGRIYEVGNYIKPGTA